MRPVFEKVCTAQNDRAHQRNEIGRGKERAERVENPRHGFARKNEAGKENARQHEGHRHLQRLHLVLRFGCDQQTEAEQREHVNESRKHHREHAAVDRHIEEETHDQK